MAQMSRRFNEEGFWEHVDEVLAENDAVMAPIIRRPGEIGSVVTRLTFNPELPEPPEAA